MKVVEAAFALLIFNISLSVVVHAGLSTVTPTYYESEILDAFGENGSLPANISTISEEQQYTTSMNVFNVITSVVTFDWLYYLIPDELDEEFIPLVVGLDIVMAFLVGLALIELFVKRADLLGGGS